MSAAKSDDKYNYKIYFEIWRDNQEFERQNISMSQPPLDLTPIDMNTKNARTLNLGQLLLVQKIQTPSH